MSKKGWICPNCGQGMAPWKPSCDCVPKPTATIPYTLPNMSRCVVCGNWYGDVVAHYCTGTMTISCGQTFSMGDQMTLWDQQ